MESYSDTLAAHLKAQNLSDRQFGEIIGVTQPTIWRYRTGERLPDARMARTIEKHTNGEVSFKCWMRDLEARAGEAA